MLILGISELDNDAGAVLVRDGELLGAANEERFSRVKQQDGVPRRAIEWLLGEAGASIGDVDTVVAVRQDVHRERPYNLQTLDQARWLDYPGKWSWKLLNWGVWRFRNSKRSFARARRSNQGLLDWAREQRIDPGAIVRPNHHFTHAACAYYASGFDKALAFTVDGQGDGQTATIYEVENGQFKLVHAVMLPHSAGVFYASLTKAAGYRPARHEGKITGLAALGEPDPECLAFAQRSLYNVEGSFEAPLVYGSYPFLQRLLQRKGKAKLAYAYQRQLENVLSTYVAHYVRKTGAKNLCIAGGVTANVRMNQKLHEIPGVENIFVFPHMGDGGLGWGAAMHSWHQQRLAQGEAYQPRRIENVFWGPNFSDAQIARVLDADGVKYQRPDDLESTLCDLLARGELLARFHGRMEFGPRALCHRSIMYQPTDPSVNDWLNQRLKRTEFMPFAPVTRVEDASEAYRGMSGAEHTARFMTITFNCTDRMARLCPAVVHVDGTARPQIVHQEQDASTHRLLSLYKERTGLPALINTSFNMHEEPIVCSPEDAVRACHSAKFRYLAIGPFLAEFDYSSPPQAKPSVVADRPS